MHMYSTLMSLSSKKKLKNNYSNIITKKERKQWLQTVDDHNRTAVDSCERKMKRKSGRGRSGGRTFSTWPDPRRCWRQLRDDVAAYRRFIFTHVNCATVSHRTFPVLEPTATPRVLSLSLNRVKTIILPDWRICKGLDRFNILWIWETGGT